MLGEILLLVAAMMIAAGGILFARGSVLADIVERTRMRREAVIEEIEFDEDGGGRVAWLAVFARMGNRLVEPGEEQSELARDLQEAGFFDPRAVPAFAFVRLIGSVVMALVMAIAMGLGPNSSVSDVGYVIGGFAAFYMGSRFWLRSKAKSRKDQIRREFTFVLDLFVLTIESGLSLDQAMRHVTRCCEKPAPLTYRSMAILIADLDKGAPYDVALTKWGARIGIDESKELASMFRQTLVHGTELSSTLRRYAEDLAERRLSAAREQVGKKTVQLTVVMVLFFLPALIVLVTGPAVNAIGEGLVSGYK